MNSNFEASEIGTCLKTVKTVKQSEKRTKIIALINNPVIKSLEA